jgi:MFS transporter, FHS family, glucose/mannose:H+ symporter
VTEPEQTAFTRLAYVAALGAFVLIGSIDAVYGPLLHPISQRFGVSLPVAGTVISISFAGALTGVLCALTAFRRSPTRPIATFAIGTVAAGSVVVASARTWPVLTVGVFLTGAGFGGTDFSLNHLMARTRPHGRAARLTILNAAFGAGAVLGPVVVSVLGGRTLILGFGVVAVGACAAAVGLLGVSTTAPPAPAAPAAPAASTAGAGEAGDTADTADASDGAGTADAGGAGTARGRGDGRERRLRAAGLRRYAGVAVVGLAYLLYVACESGVAGWIPAHLEAFRYSARFGAIVTSGFWGAMTIGRLAAAPASRVMPARRIVLAACPVLALALALTAVRAIAPACYVVAGFAAAPIFPMGLDWVAATFTSYRPATSWALTGSFAGGIVGPAVVAGVVSVAGLYAVPAVLTSLAVATGVAFLAIRRPPRATAPNPAAAQELTERVE